MKKIITLHSIKRLLSLAAIIMLVGVAGCSLSATPTNTPTPIHAPSIYYINISINDAGDSTSGISVKSFAGIQESADTYTVHIIYYYDANPPFTTEHPAYSANGTYIIKYPDEESALWKNVTPGSHVLYAQLVNSENDTSFAPPVTAWSIINVPAVDSKTPEIRTITVLLDLPSPEYVFSGTLLPLTSIVTQVTATTHNFKLSDDKIGKQNVAGEGHMIYYLDVDPPTAPGESALTADGTFKATTEGFYLWDHVPPGKHTFSVQLVNNDNTPLDPAVVAQVTITVPSIYW